MAIKISSDGAEKILKYTTGVTTTTETLILKLFSSNTSPGPLTVLGDFTEVTGGGYAAKTLNATQWTIAGNSASTAAQLFTFTSAIGQIYGYYLVGATSGQLIASERFISGPYNIAASGDTLTVTATLSIA